MIAAIHQPQYLPWLGYFDKIATCDVFIFLDNVQFKKNEWQNRNKIKTSQGWQWISVPVIQKFPQKIMDVEINNTEHWCKKHLNALVSNYSKALYFKEYLGFFEQVYAQLWTHLAEVNIHFIQYLVQSLGIDSKLFVRSSQYETREGPTERLIDLCKHVGADVFLSGKDGALYLEQNKFEQAGIKVLFQNYIHPKYNQLYGEFVPFMSVIDLLFNCGPESLSILRKGG